MPTGAGKSAGRVSVRVVPDSSGFRTELKADLDKIERGLQVQVKAALDDTALKASIEKLRQTDIKLDVQASTAGVRAEIERVGRAGGKVDIPVSLSGANIVRAELIRLATNRVIDLVVNVNKRSLLAAGSALASLSGGKSAVGYLRQIGGALGGLDKSIPKISAIALGVGSIGALAFSSVAGTLSLASSLVAVAGAGVALPGILAGAGLAMGTLTVALSTAKTELAGLVPSLKKFQTAIGGAFFKEAKGPITDLVNTITGDLRPAFEGLSSSLGDFAAQTATALNGVATNGVLAAVIDRTTTAINNAKAAIVPLVTAFSTLAGVGSSYLPALGTGFANVAAQFNSFITGAAADGSLKGWIDTGIAGLKSLASIAGSVGGILKGLFDAANAATGGNGLAVFAQGLQQISDAVNSSGLQTALTTIFQGAQAGAEGLASAIGPIGGLLQSLAPTISGVFATAGSVIGGALSAIAGALKDPAFATGLTAFFDGIASGVQAVLPVLPAIVGALSSVASTAGTVAANLGPVFAASFAAIAPVVSQVLAAIQPLIPVLGAALANSVSILAASLTVLAPIFSAIITAVAPLIPILAGALAGAIATLGPAITQVVTAIGGSLPAIISAIASTVAVLAPTIAQVLTAILPLVPAILSLIPPLLQIATAVLPLIPALVAQIVPLVLQLVPVIIQILAAILPLVPSFLQLVIAGIQLAAAIQGPIFGAFSAFASFLPTIVAGVQGLLGIFTAFVQGAVALFTGNFSAIPGIVGNAISSVGAFIKSGLAGTLGVMVSFVASGIARVVAFGSGIVSTVTSAMSSFVGKITSAISQAVSVIASLPGKAKSALGNIGGTFASVGGDIIRGIASGVGSAVGALTSAIKSAAASALSAAKSALGINSPSRVFAQQVGQHIPTGIAMGIKSSQGVLDSALGNMVNPALAGLNAARVASPSLAAGSAGAAGNTYMFGDVVGHNINSLVDEIERRQQLRDYAAAVAF